MTLVEFLAPLKTGAAWKKVLALLYYKKRYENVDAMTVEQIRSALVAARIPKVKTMNVADVLSKSGAKVDSPRAEGGRRLWSITYTGEKEVRRLLPLPETEPEIEHDVATLTKLATTVTDRDARDFIEEAVKCLQFDALRAAVVFLWSGAVVALRKKAWRKGVKQVNVALGKHDPKARTVSKLDDFAYVRDALLLDVLFDLAVLDKSEKKVLGQALDLRNDCGHPTKYRPREKKVSSFIEDVIGIVF